MDITGYRMISDDTTVTPNFIYICGGVPALLTFLPTARNVPNSERTPILSISPLKFRSRADAPISRNTEAEIPILLNTSFPLLDR
jgi:hypothetical protein